MTLYQIQKKINTKLEKIQNLFDEAIKLKDEKNLLCDYYENEVKCKIDIHGDLSIKYGKKQKAVLGYITYLEDFVDEDCGEVVSITRSLLCRVNGNPCNESGKLFENMGYDELMKWL